MKKVLFPLFLHLMFNPLNAPSHGSSKPSQKFAPKIFDNMVNPMELIDDIARQKSQDISQIYQDKVTLNTTKKIPAVEDLRIKTNALQTTLSLLSNWGSDEGAILRPSVFGQKTIVVTSGDGAVTVTALKNAPLMSGNHTLVVQQIAQKDRIVCPYIAPSSTTPFGLTGTLCINNISISIIPSDSWATVMQHIALTSAQTGVSGTLVQLNDEGGMSLVLQAQNYAQPINLSGTSETLVGTNGLMLPSTPTPLDNLVAQFTFDGLTMTRNENTFSNVIGGIQFSLQKPSTIPTVFGVDYLKSATLQTIKDFVNAYNEVVIGLSKQKAENPDGTPHEDAVLYYDFLILTLGFDLQMMRYPPNAGAIPYTSLADIGIYTVYNAALDATIMTVDDNILTDCIHNKDYTQMIQFFGNYNTVSNPAFIVQEFKVTVSDSVMGTPYILTYSCGADGTYTATLNNQPMTLIGTNTLAGTGPFEGLIVSYLLPLLPGNEASTIITLTRGIAPKVCQVLKHATDRKEGSLFEESVQRYVRENDTYRSEMKSMEARYQAEKKAREPLLQRLYTMNQKTTMINNVLDQLNNQKRHK